MADDIRVQAILAELLQDEAAAGEHSLLLLLCRHAVRHLDVDGCGVWLMTADDLPQILVETGVGARALQELEFVTGEGPGIDAFRTGLPVGRTDLAATAASRWPGYGSGALAAGVAAVFAFPLLDADARLGVLEIHRIAPGQPAPEEMLEAAAYAEAATILLRYLQQDPADGVDPTFRRAWADRSAVATAGGMIAVEADVPLPDAVSMLRARAFADSRAVDEVAADVLDHRVAFEPVEDAADG